MRELVITDSAKSDLEAIVSFLKQAYSRKIQTNFLADFARRLALIEQMPFMYPASAQNPTVRRCVISRYTSCFYSVTETHILILAVVDNRSDPDALQF